MVDRVVETGGFGGFWSKTYYRGDKYHRDGGLPAVLFENFEEWWVNGKRHRDDGLPAIEYSGGSKRGSKKYYVNGKLHRDGGLPAVELRDGSKAWYVNGKRHRDDGLPAIECSDGTKYYYVNDIKLTEEQAQFIREKKMKRVKKIYWKWYDMTYRIDKPAHMARLEREIKMDMHYLENEIGYKLN